MRDKLELALDAGRKTGALTLEYFGRQADVRDKGGGHPVSTADLEADLLLKEILLGACPDYGWLSEETADDARRLHKETVWIVDPIDGTREFLQRIPEYVVSIALVRQGEPVVGVIFNPARDELYAAVRGGGAFLNGKRVFCSATTRLDQATLIVSRSEAGRGEVDPFHPHLGQVRPLGSVSYKLASVAAGRGDLNLSVQPKNEWDVCAGDLLVREAGGLMLDLEGRVRSYNQLDPRIDGGLVAGNQALTSAMLELVGEVV